MPAAAVDEQGTIVFAGTSSGTVTYPCTTCSYSLSVATTGNIAGLAGTIPFTLSWAVPNAAFTLILDGFCSQPTVPNPYADVQQLSADIQIPSAVFNYDGSLRNGSFVDVQLGMQQLQQSATIIITSVNITVQWQGVTVLNFQVLAHEGPFFMAPTSPSALCPPVGSGGTPTTVAVAGALVTAA